MFVLDKNEGGRFESRGAKNRKKNNDDLKINIYGDSRDKVIEKVFSWHRKGCRLEKRRDLILTIGGRGIGSV